VDARPATEIVQAEIMAKLGLPKAKPHNAHDRMRDPQESGSA
jgi:hypothetical protein